MGNYVTAEQLREHKIDGLCVDLTAYEDNEIEDKIDLAEEYIERLTNNVFYSDSETYYFDGSGLTYLYFEPLVSQELLTLTSVTELDFDGSTVLYTYVENEDFKRYPHHLEMGQSSATGRLRYGYGGVWPQGEKNIKIVGTWGASAVPKGIKEATILLTLEKLKPGSTRMRTSDIKRQEWLDYEQEMQISNVYGSETGFPEVDRLLAAHYNYSSLFQVMPDTQ